VPVRTVASLVDKYRIEPPDILSIDVESHEGAVIRGTPFERWRPKVLVVESTAPLSSVASYVEWEPILLRHGYVFAIFNGVNRFYLREDMKAELPKFETPVNVLDHYLRQEIVALSNQANEFRDKYEREKTAREFDRAQFNEVKAGWEWGRMQLQYIHAISEQEHARIAAEREDWRNRLEAFERARADWERERDAYERERAERDHLLVSAQSQLRPYRLIDRIGLVTASYSLAKRIRRKRAS
jgi:hypothetical protein